MWDDVDELLAAGLEGNVRMDVPEEPEPAPRVVTYWAPGSNSRFGALRQMVIPPPPKTDRWGKPIREGPFR